MQPINDYIVVEREPVVEKVGSLYLPQGSLQKPSRGTVVAVGQGILLQDGTYAPLQVKPGDRVLYKNWTGDEIKVVDGEEFFVIRQSDVIGVL